MTFLHYVHRDAYDNRELSTPTTSRDKAMRDLARLRESYPFARLATICIDDDQEVAE